MYLEKIIESCKPACYEVYETAPDWVTYLGDTYGSLTDLKLHVADGYSLRYTRDNSCDLVHAHAVFVYLPMLQVMEYLIECARVCAPGGYIVFDSFLDTSFSYADAKDWLSGEWRFPVIIPRNVIMGLAEEYSLKSYGEFREIYGYSHVNYLIFRKQIS
jgi:ubiquinone/menaquinone biosynthesis C-methylase UbiE